MKNKMELKGLKTERWRDLPESRQIKEREVTPKMSFKMSRDGDRMLQPSVSQGFVLIFVWIVFVFLYFRSNAQTHL